jgi:hypothetical protein
METHQQWQQWTFDNWSRTDKRTPEWENDHNGKILAVSKHEQQWCIIGDNSISQFDSKAKAFSKARELMERHVVLSAMA